MVKNLEFKEYREHYFEKERNLAYESSLDHSGKLENSGYPFRVERALIAADNARSAFWFIIWEREESRHA